MTEKHPDIVQGKERVIDLKIIEKNKKFFSTMIGVWEREALGLFDLALRKK